MKESKKEERLQSFQKHETEEKIQKIRVFKRWSDHYEGNGTRKLRHEIIYLEVETLVWFAQESKL